jgi:hypothetical protein
MDFGSKHDLLIHIHHHQPLKQNKPPDMKVKPYPLVTKAMIDPRYRAVLLQLRGGRTLHRNL